MYLVSKTETFAKLFFLVSFTGLFAYVVLAFYTFHTAYISVTHLKTVQNQMQRHPAVRSRFIDDLKYILLWTQPNTAVVDGIAEGQVSFIENNCSQINCFWTTNKELLNGNYTNFDAIVLDLPIVRLWKKLQMPQDRTVKQKYVFRGMLAADDHTICNAHAENYFNWTWSYKLYSDIFNPFFEVLDTKGKMIAPSIDVEWPNNNNQRLILPDTEIKKLNTKNKAVIWIMKKCQTRFNRMSFVKDLYFALKQLKMKLDIYGCGHLKCPPEGCVEVVRRDYYFYLAYEDSISEDYVTKEVLTAYDNYAVPIVISGADLTKFLPTGSYIDGHNTPVDEIAEIIEYTIKSRSYSYFKYFLWRNYFTIREVGPLRTICDLCSNLNSPTLVTRARSYETFRKWWYPGPLAQKCYPRGAEKFAEVLSYVNSSKGHPVGGIK